jgi:hypothetical protein
MAKKRMTKELALKIIITISTLLLIFSSIAPMFMK